MILLALAIAPAIAIILYILEKDKYNKEPFKYLFIAFILGVISTLAAIVIEFSFRIALETVFDKGSVLFFILLAYGVVACSEEYMKFIVLRYYAYRLKEFDEPLDGIIYGVMIGMGFATVENIMYVLQSGYGTALGRMFISVPAHGCFAVIMGYYTGLAKFNKERSKKLLSRGLWLAIFYHGTFDFFLFLGNSNAISPIASGGLLSLGALVSLFTALKISRRAINLHQERSRIEYERINRQEV